MAHLFVRSEFVRFHWESCRHCGERIVSAQRLGSTSKWLRLEQAPQPPGDAGKWFRAHECEEETP